MSPARRPFALLVFVLAAWWPATASAQPAEPEPEDLVVLSGDVVVRRGQELGEVVVLAGDVEVAGVVRGDVVVLDGRIEIAGQVSGSVVNVTGPVALGPSSRVGGDVLAHGRVVAEPGAQVDGDVREHASFAFRAPIDAFGAFAPWLAVWASALALGLLLLLVAPRGADAVAAAAREAPWASLGWGAAASVALPLAGVLAVFTLVWLPLGLGLLLALFLLFSVGLCWSAFALGRLLWRPPRGRVLAFAFGWAILAALAAIPFVGGAVWVAGSAFGLGTATVALWRARPRAERVGGRHRPGGKMPEPVGVQPMVTEREMGEEGTGL